MVKIIKTILAETTKELDEAVNAFMKERRENLPVRTEVYTTENAVVHKATIFYNDMFADEGNKGDYSEGYAEEKIDEKPAATRSKLGALWLHQGGIIKGKFHDEDIALPEKVARELIEKERLDATIKGENVFIMKSKYKREPHQPDYVILTRRG